MVIKVTVPEGVKYQSLTEGEMAVRYNLKRKSLSRYKTLYETAKLLKLTPQATFGRAKNSRRLHACELPSGAILFHPDSVLKEIRYQATHALQELASEEKRVIAKMA